MRMLDYRSAINEAMKQSMEEDKAVFTYGIDVGDHKRIFGTTNGLVEQFGEERCFSTPLSEDAMTGMGLGSAINGLRPVHVHMRVDFLLLAMNQIANMVSSYQYSAQGKVKVPFTMRAIIGRGWGQSWQHSKSVHSFFAHLPGLKVVMPATAYEAKGMLTSAIRDDNPVLVMEHRWLYDAEGEVPEESYTVPLSGSSLVKEGKDVTIVATSWMNVEAIHAATILEKYDISVEVINVRSITDFDEKMIQESILKTNRCIIADNDWLSCGFSAELATVINEKCFRRLLKPVTRLGFAFTPCPCTRPLENNFYANAFDIIKAVGRQMNRSLPDLSSEQFYSYENKFRGPF